MVRCENEALRFSSLLKYVLGRRVALEMSVVLLGDTAREREGNISLFLDAETVEIQRFKPANCTIRTSESNWHNSR